MQSRVFIRRSPQVCRIVKAPAVSRNMSLFSPTPFLVRGSPFPPHPFASFEREVAPLFRMMEDLNRTFDHHFLPSAATARAAPVPFQPRFDIREVDGAYELRGELPGVESNNIEVEFTDANTLIIRGRTESESSSGTPPAALRQQEPAKAVEAAEPTATNAVADDAASTHSTSSYQKATVEDEAAEFTTSTPGQATPAESTTLEAPQPYQVNTQSAATESAATSTDANTNATTANTSANANASTPQGPRYWVSERHTGSFQRVFNFPGKINQEAVTASLKNGVLNVVVPKAVVQARRRISVQ